MAEDRDAYLDIFCPGWREEIESAKEWGFTREEWDDLRNRAVMGLKPYLTADEINLYESVIWYKYQLIRKGESEFLWLM